MIYQPQKDIYLKIIQGEIEHLGSPTDSSSAVRELMLNGGKSAVNFVLKAVEQPFEHPRYSQIRDKCLSVLKWYAQDEMMTMSELQRYRQILANEKDSNAS